MPVPTAISALSQTAASNSPATTESPTSADDYLRQYSAFIAMLRDGIGFTDPVQLASGATTSIGAQNSLFVEITGTTTITSFGTTYEGPRFLRFTGALALTHNATALSLPGGSNITTAAGDTCIAIPNYAGNGWNVYLYQRSDGASLDAARVNWLHNPDGAVYQRAVAATADDAYMDDRWYALTQTGTITPSQVSNPEDGYRYALRLTQSQAAAQRMGRAQIIEGKDAMMLRGKSVTFGGRVKLSTSANVRMAILAWTGTEDSVTSDVVNDWTSASYTAGGFFINTTTTVVATSSTAMTAATAADVSVSGTIPSTATNIIVLYWTEATAAQNVTLDAWGLRLIEGSRLIDYIRRSYPQEYALCLRFAYMWAKHYIRWNHGGSGAANFTFNTPFPVPMRTTPSVTAGSVVYAGVGVFGNDIAAANNAAVGWNFNASTTGDAQATWTNYFFSADL